MQTRPILILSLLCALSTLSGQAPIKSAQLSGTSQVTGGTFTLQTGVVFTAAAGSTVNLSAGTLTLGTGQIGWAAVNKTGGAFGGDSGSGGTIGLVPAPAAGDAAAGKFLKADGTWAAGGAGATTFLGLTDTPANYTSAGGKILAVNSGATAIEFLSSIPWTSVNKTGSSLADLTTRSATDLTSGTVAVARLPPMVGDSGSGGTAGLVPAPGTGDAAAGKFLKADGTWAVGGSGSTTFLGLTDTPSTYTAQAGKLVRVNAGATALEFTAAAVGGVANFVDLGDVPNSYAGQGGKTVAVKADASGLEFITGGGGGGITWVSPAPTTSTSAGTAGSLAYEAGHLYVCVSNGRWHRAALYGFGSGEQLLTVSLNYASNGDANGLFYFMGSARRTSGWSHPETTWRLVTSLASGVFSGTTSLTMDREPSDFATNNTVGAWVGWDIGSGATLTPSHYSLRSRSLDGSHLRNWKLQGTNTVSAVTTAGFAGATWTDLNVQTSNTALDAASKWLTLPITGAGAYRYLRIVTTGPESSGFNYLTLGEVEFYGTYTVTLP